MTQKTSEMLSEDNHLDIISKTNNIIPQTTVIKKKILVIEKNQSIRAGIQKTLAFLDMDVDGVENGQEGLSRTLSDNYHLIICDVNVPQIDGYTLLEKIRKDPKKKMTPVILINGENVLSEIRHGMNLGADDYLTKPINIKDLVRSIKTRLKKSADTIAAMEEKYKGNMQTLKKKIYHNPITDLPNEEALLKRIKKKDNNEFIMIHIAIIGLNEIHDFIGRESFNKIQKEIVKRTKECECEFESTELFQLKNEEFFILAPYKKSEPIDTKHEQIEIYCSNLIAKIQSPMGQADLQISLSTSIGINITGIFNNDISESLREAKIAKNYATAMGSCCYFFYNNGLKGKFNEISRKYLSQYINIDQKRNIYRKTKDPHILNNFEIKVFFLYPHSIVQKSLIQEIISNEYAAYVLNDHVKALSLLEKYTNSILFINIDSHLSEEEWDKYINGIMYNAKTQDVKIGILSFYEDKVKIEKYLMQMMLPCGFIILKQGEKESRDIIMKVLEANEAKGARKYVRVKCEEISSVSFSIKLNNNVVKGIIYDISSYGMACGFSKEDEIYLREGTILENVQLQLRGNLCLVEGKIVGIHNNADGRIRYVVIFEKMDPAIKTKIHNFISVGLQQSIDEELNLIE